MRFKLYKCCVHVWCCPLVIPNVHVTLVTCHQWDNTDLDIWLDKLANQIQISRSRSHTHPPTGPFALRGPLKL